MQKHEDDLKRNVKRFKERASQEISNGVEAAQKSSEPHNIKDIVDTVINENIPFLGIKKKVDESKKRILINSQIGQDKNVSDLVYNFLLSNNVPAKVILYSNCDDEVSKNS